ncbi:MAG: hypothetical protein KDK34_17295, partial [Leptospiraceae bacterium]|nr:hypothetical protein [Leptospiraceae bacterium]
MQSVIQRTSRFVMLAFVYVTLAMAFTRSSSAAPPGFELNPAPGVRNAPARGQITVTFPAAVNSESLSVSSVYVYGS